MKISKLIEELQREKEKHGDIEVTCTGSFIPDGYGELDGNCDIFETTVETLKFIKAGEGRTGENIGARIRLYL